MPVPARTLQFNPTVLFSVRDHASDETKAGVAAAIAASTRFLGSVLRATRKRQWGGDGVYVNSVSELGQRGLFPQGDYHQRNFGPDLLRPGWSAVAT
jgi:hypothetical protein